MLAFAAGLELRRWWSVFDATEDIMPLWHSILFALVLNFGMEGKSAWDIAAQARPVVRRQDDADTKKWAFKHQVASPLCIK